MKDTRITFQKSIRPIYKLKEAELFNSLGLMTENSFMQNEKSKQVASLIFVKGSHKWRFEWEKGNELLVVESITEIAESDNSNFDWFDAATICHEMIKISSKAA